MSTFSFCMTYGGEWFCLGKTCSKWTETPDEWITDNCRPEGNPPTDMMCNVLLEDKPVRVPLSVLNITNARSCREYKCKVKVFIKGVLEVKNE